MQTTGNPTLQEFLVLIINFAFTLLSSIVTGVSTLLPSIVQLIVNAILSGTGGGG